MSASAVFSVGGYSVGSGGLPVTSALLFQPSDYVGELDQQEQWCQHKFRTTCKKARKNLSQFGIDLPALQRLHVSLFAFDMTFYRDTLIRHCRDYLRDKKGVYIETDGTRMADLLLSWYFEPADKEEEFSEVLSSLRVIRPSDLLRNDAKLDEFQTNTRFDNAKFHRFILSQFLDRQPYAWHLDSDFFELYASGQDDLYDLYCIGLPIWANEPKTIVELDFTDFVDFDRPMSEAQLRTFLEDIRTTLKRRTELASSLFGGIPTEVITAKSSTLEAVVDRSTLRTRQKQGDHLEELVSMIFRSEAGFTVKQKARRPGEEVDLVVMNKLNSPFWSSMHSPLLLVECKNQRRKVEPRDLRNFEVKVQDRRAMCRLGIIVSTSGFTKGCSEVAIRCGRQGFKILLIGYGELQRRLNGTATTAEWLEEIILEQF